MVTEIQIRYAVNNWPVPSGCDGAAAPQRVELHNKDVCVCDGHVFAQMPVSLLIASPLYEGIVRQSQGIHSSTATIVCPHLSCAAHTSHARFSASTLLRG